MEGQHDLHRPDAGKRHLARGRRQLVVQELITDALREIMRIYLSSAALLILAATLLLSLLLSRVLSSPIHDLIVRHAEL